MAAFSFLLAAGCEDEVLPPREPTLTLGDLIEELHVLDAWAEPETRPYRSLQQSSQQDGGSDPTADAWWNNVDKGHFRRMINRDGRQEAVIMEASGSGAIVRIWAANPRGTIRFYFDGEDTPRIEENMADFLSGEVDPFGAPFAYIAARGYNFYFPIPFLQGVMVTVDDGFTFRPEIREDEGLLYYHVGYRLFDVDAVESFDADTLVTNAAAIERARTVLSNPPSAPDDATIATNSEGGPLEISASPGGEVLRGIEITTSGETPEALRAAVLTIEFDGEETVRTPLSDFFGSGVGQNAHTSVVTHVDGEMMGAYFPMPFAESARIHIEGADRFATMPVINVAHEAYAFSETTRYFHSGWRAFPQFLAARQDLPWLRLTGEGVYVGNTATIGNPTVTWWGEGDERIYVDEDPIHLPSFPGTGTEDYYGYAFTDPSLFTEPYHGQVRSGTPMQRGIISLHRFHVIDAIPYARSFRFDMEFWHWHLWSDASVDVVHYWYARGGTDDLQPVAAGEAIVPDIDSFNTEQ